MYLSGRRSIPRKRWKSVVILAVGLRFGGVLAAQDSLSFRVVPRIAPELALQEYEVRSWRQASQLGSYSATSTVRAVLLDTDQYGEFELNRRYIAPKTLQFTPVRFVGNGFVKTNVITRFLQSEVDHVQKDEPTQTAIANQNYKFSYQGTEQIAGHLTYALKVKPRKKRRALFKGRILLDAFSGSLLRVEGHMVKSPSIFVKNIDFVQDYADFGVFTFPVHMHSQARAKLIGRVEIDVSNRDYQPVATSEMQKCTTSQRLNNFKLSLSRY